MDEELLGNSVDILKEIRAGLHDNVEDSVVEKLDEVIHDLEASQFGNTKKVITALEILILLGTLMQKVPEIAATIEFLTQLIKNTPNY